MLYSKKRPFPNGGLRTVFDFTVSSDCDIPGRAMGSVEDRKTILVTTPPPFCRALSTGALRALAMFLVACAALLGSPGPAYAAKPSAPTDLRVVLSDSCHVVIKWDAPTSNGGKAITRYENQGKVENGSFGDWRYEADPPLGNPLGTTLTILDSTCGVSYTYQIRARNADGAGPDVGITFIPIRTEPPNAPVNLTAVGGLGKVDLSWTSDLHQYMRPLSYQVRYKTGSDSFSAWRGIPGSYYFTTSYTLTGLGNSKTYTIEVRATNSEGNGKEASVEATTQGGTLALNLNTVAGDDTVNIAEKTAGFTISGDTGTEDGVTVSVTVGSTTLQTTSDSNGAWSVSVPPAASYITGTSVTVTVSASKTGFTTPNNVTRTVTVNLTAPSTPGYTAPATLQVGVAITAMSPTTSDTDIASYSAAGLPSGLVINTTGVISGTPNSANASDQQATVTVSDSVDNTAMTSITFPAVAKGDQTLTGFQYSASTVTFGSPAPTVMAPGGVQTTVAYTATPSNVCTVNGSTGALTLLEVGACVITATAASSNNYNQATAMFTVTMQAQGMLALNLDTVAGDDTVNIAEKMAGFTISGDTGTDDGVSVNVTIGSQSPLTATSDSNGAWSVSVPSAASYITGTSVAVSVSASKTGFTPPNDVTRTLAVDLAAPSVSYTTPSGLQVEVAITAMSPTTSDTDIASYSAAGLPSGLGLNTDTGVISGIPNSANASAQQATVTVSDTAGNPATVDIAFPMVAKGNQTLTEFRYGASTVTFDSPAPTVTAPGGVRTTVAYTATPPNVCTVDGSTGALTLLGVGGCVITATATSNNNYNEATAMFTVTVLAQGALALNLDTVAGDDTVNIAEKTAGFTISGDTGTENGVSVSVTVASTTLQATSGSNGAWSVNVPPDASYITGTSVAVTVSASKTGLTTPNDVTRTVTVDLTAPSAPSYTAPATLQVGVAITAMSPSGGSGISGYSATGLPSGLGINTTTGVISGTPDSANASTQQATVTVTDSAANTATTSITFPAVGEGDQTSNPDTGSPDTENPDTEETEDEAHPDERRTLLALYRATGGENWEYSDYWNTPAPVDTWHGVTVDSEGRVTELDLDANGLSGEVPPSLVENLPNLRRLYLNDNTLSAVPLAQLRDLLEEPDPALEELALWGNDLLGETGNISSVELDRRVERAALRALYERTGGPRWKDRDNWLDETDLFSFSEWYEVMTDDDGRVMELDLSDNGLSGELGRELEALGSLYSLDLSGNPDLDGELPRGLMELTELFVVNIEDTGMCAPGDTEFNQWLEGISFDGEICAEDGDDSPDTGMGAAEPGAGGGGGGCAVASGGSGVPFNLLLLIVALVLKLAAPAKLP